MTRTAATTGTRSGRGRGLVLLLAAVVAGLLGVLALSPGQARAHDHEVPKTVLKKGAEGLQAGTRVIESDWVRLAGDGTCARENASYVFGYPGADRVAAGAELRVRVLKAQRPDSFEVGAYRAVDGNGRPAGEGRRLRSALEPVVRDGEAVAWDAVFSVGRPGRDHYLIGEGHWQDREGCGGADQYAYWGFHVKTRGIAEEGADRGPRATFRKGERHAECSPGHPGPPDDRSREEVPRMVDLMGLEEQADRDFVLARRRARTRHLWRRLRGGKGSGELSSFEEARRKAGACGGVRRGRATVEVSRIFGSAGKHDRFDEEFMPLTGASRERWKRVDRAFRLGAELPPVSLYCLGGCYFALDGNHRVSVARFHGAGWIDADVTEFRGPLLAAPRPPGRPPISGPSRPGGKVPNNPPDTPPNKRRSILWNRRDTY